MEIVNFIEKFKSQYPIKTICKALKFNRSTYYKNIGPNRNSFKEKQAAFQKQINEIWIDSKKRYGAIKIQRMLEKSGINASIKRVQRHMKMMGIHSIIIQKFRPQSKSVSCEGRENIVNQQFQVPSINHTWAADITYIHTRRDGWTYLASVMDLYSKKIIGYSYQKKMTTEIVLESIENACLNVKSTKNIILHSDLGTQYTSEILECTLSAKGMLHSFSRKGNPYDNACIESFHSILKKEEIYQNNYDSFEDARRAIFTYIESWYNRKRIHGSIGYLTPEEKHNLCCES